MISAPLALADEPAPIAAPPPPKPRRRPVKSILGTTITLEDFLAEVDEIHFQVHDRERIVDQALVLMEQFYVHLPLKRAMYAVDPAQRLKLLRRRVGVLSQVEFSREMLSIFTELRDLHTNYLLPDPFRDRTAILPFLIEEFYEGDTRNYMVSHVTTGFRHPYFRAGVIVTHWNGLPIDRAVALNAEHQMGSNADARHARGLEAMTIRPLMLTVPPDEEWIVVSYLAKGDPHESQFRWRVIEPTPAPTAVDPTQHGTSASLGLGYDALTETARRVKKALFAPKAVENEKRITELGTTPPAPDDKSVTRDLKKNSTLPDVFSFRTVETPYGKFGYIRIWTFMVAEAESFVKEFIRIADMLPQEGLILDVRGNGGGLINAGEQLLQVLTPRTIEPSRLHFVNTPLTLTLCAASDELKPWKDSIEQSVETGAVYSYGFPLAPIETYNALGQSYQGAIVLIVDALCYSTTDIFAAGFQDHNIGRILGTNGNMGAGGANVWTHELLREILPNENSPLKELPNRASFRIALRQSTRVGNRSGVPLEGLGVVPDQVHHMTANDLLDQNADLIDAAGKLLSQMPTHELAARVVSGTNDKIRLEIISKNISRLDVYVDGRPQLSLDVQDGKKSFTVKVDAAHTRRIELRGFEENELATTTRVGLLDGD